LLAALVLSTIFCASALILFYELVSRQHEKQEAFRSVIALMLFPTAFFLCAGYTESLFLTLVFCFWHFALKRRWFIAAIFGSLATVTRLQGIVLTPIMYWMMLASLLPETDSKPREQVRQVGKLLLGSSRDKTQLSRYKFEWVAAPLPPIIVRLGYQLSLKIAGFNTITGLLQTGWNIRTVPPWIGFYQFIQRLLTTKFIYMDWVDLALFVFVLALSVIGLRHLDVGYSLYFWLTLSIFFMRGTPSLAGKLQSVSSGVVSPFHYHCAHSEQDSSRTDI